ncbi:methylmalonyl Co-A mutase-associated GTPase MeaB [Marinactinospora thermotolerans]|uniref:LAO/AO transport system kinase n=1 Tax=Marinactinospora thermotolerans DSM 45154 TaxID=1122192 RepID=A0A1T4Q825_9ACTN|nr:methylmalonyl Co-A mutase-associated GTPase MeaB [Marinactinospora thermotolerans]SJZ99691.1 LAO/AO transport system kinase [Marinactinospora thermotolerans DSM 45154]
MDVGELVDRALRRDRRAVARAITLVENASPALREIMARLAPHGGRARVIGLTGAPGVGKSTSTSALVTALRARGETVGVLAVDPSSPFTGGALLGDRVRMQEHAGDAGVFIRSMASRGHLGGLSWATPHALRVLDAAGYDTILVETVGVGQAEVDIAAHADTTVVLLAPGMGDGIQAAKAGVLEIADLLVVNKADRDGARATVRDLRQMTAQAALEPGGWRPPVVSTVAAEGKGVDELVERLDLHARYLDDSGEGDRRRRARAREEIVGIVLAELRSRTGDLDGRADLDQLGARVAAGRLDPYTAADELLASLA